MKHKLKIITLLTLGALGSLVNAQVPNQPMPQIQQPVAVGTNSVVTNTTVTSTGTRVEVPTQPTVNEYSHLGEGNAYEKAVTPLLREISRKKSILELKKLDKEIAKLDEVDKKDVTSGLNPSSGYMTMPPPIPPSQMLKMQTPSMPVSTPTVTSVEDMAILANPVKVLMTYGDENDLYAKIAVGDQGGYTVRKGDILPDGRTVLKVSSNYMEVQKPVKTKKSTKVTTQKIFVSAGTTSSASSNTSPNMGGSSASMNMPSLATIPAANNAMTTTLPR